MGHIKPIPVIDLFAGPGGLGEGFSSFDRTDGESAFRVHLSIEKDTYAHSTLALRSFYRQFSPAEIPEEYYKLLRGELTRKELFASFPEQAKTVLREAWRAELGVEPAREVHNRVRQALNGAEPWVLIGGPPCQAYSVMGRARRKGLHGYVPDEDHRQTLYLEYLKIIAEHWPAVFVMENVKGLVSAKLAGSNIFDRILADLEAPASASGNAGRKNGTGPYHYRIYSLKSHGKLFGLDPLDYLIETERHGIPQSRHRIVLFGVRSDIPEVPGTLPASPAVALHRVLDGLPRLRSGLTQKPDTADFWSAELLSAFGRRWVNSTDEGVSRAVLETISNLKIPRNGRGGEFVAGAPRIGYLPDWFLDHRLGGVCNHRSKAHMPSDLHRYLYVSSYGQVHGRSPRLRDFPADLLPDHANASASARGTSGLFADRFRVQLKNSPATTITSHIRADGHYYIHYDPAQCRSLTVREAARVQTFPDNYVFCGPRTQQFNQVGNAVPPLLARQIAEIAWELLS
jgi:DNA (cytosine-5)-methyltransferase 1